jgi:hypothetical protein
MATRNHEAGVYSRYATTEHHKVWQGIPKVPPDPCPDDLKQHRDEYLPLCKNSLKAFQAAFLVESIFMTTGAFNTKESRRVPAENGSFRVHQRIAKVGVTEWNFSTGC